MTDDKKIHVFNERGEPVASVEHLLTLLKQKDEEIDRLRRIIKGQALRKQFTDVQIDAPTRH